LEIYFLGTGSGKINPSRFFSSLYIHDKKKNLLIDTGDGISRRLLEERIKFNEIKNILITHFHSDHFSGFPGLITQMKLGKRRTALNIFVHRSLAVTVNSILRSFYLFEERLGFKLNFKYFSYNISNRILGRNSFIARQNSHLSKYAGLKRAGKVSFSSSSFLLNFTKNKIFFTGDLGSANDLFLFKDQKVDTLITEVTHVNLDEIIEAASVQKIKKIVLTHIPDNEKQIRDLIVKKYDNKKIILSTDGLRLKI